MPDGSKGFTISGIEPDERQPQREKIIEAVAAAGVVFFRCPDGHAYATVPLNPDLGDASPVAHYRVRGRRFQLLCRKLFGTANPVASARGARPGSVSDSAMNEAIPAFEAMALGGGAQLPAVRLMQNNGAVWLDLGDDTHRAVRIAAEGWTVVCRVDAPLIRPDGFRAMPMPVHDGGALVKLRRMLNLPDGGDGDGDFRLLVAWLVAALHPSGPYPVLALDGEQGSGKTTVARILRRLVDPNAADLRAMPRCEDDLLIAATNGRVVALDNVSFIEADMADALCRVATGAGFGKRTLYSDLGETIVQVCRPVLLNGIPSLLARGDLADRAIAVTLPTIPDANRRTEADVWANFDAAAPGILAALLDGLATALRRMPGLRLPALPRMADFALLACAAAPAFGWTEADMLAALDTNRAASVQAVVEADPIAEAVRAIAGDCPERWEGTASALLAEINGKVPDDVKRERGWPKDAARLSARLKRVAPALRRVGVEVALPKSGGRAGRNITLTPTIGKQRSERSQRSAWAQDADIPQNTRNADEEGQRSAGPPSVPGTLTGTLGNAAEQGQRSANPLTDKGWNAGNAGNAESLFLGDEVVL